jgi:LmbE family N-acetylglucosaminyl deacetylase
MKRTLIVVAHLDDESFGMGGTLAQMCLEDPKEVKVVSLCCGRDKQNSQARLGAFLEIQKMLGFDFAVHDYFDMELELFPLREINRILENHIDLFKPQRIFTLSENDLHQDHQIVSKATKIAARPSRTGVEEIYEFQTPGSEPFTATYFDTVNDVKKAIVMKRWMMDQYTTEKRPQVTFDEYFKTVYKRFEI